ncbi:hypothetical protein GCM10027403_33980 [Arthrobacter tecti]
MGTLATSTAGASVTAGADGAATAGAADTEAARAGLGDTAEAGAGTRAGALAPAVAWAAARSARSRRWASRGRASASGVLARRRPEAVFDKETLSHFCLRS